MFKATLEILINTIMSFVLCMIIVYFFGFFMDITPADSLVTVTALSLAWGIGDYFWDTRVKGRHQ